MRKLKTIPEHTVIQEYCDVCGKEFSTGYKINGITFCHREPCNTLGHYIWRVDKAIDKIKQMPFFN